MSDTIERPPAPPALKRALLLPLLAMLAACQLFAPAYDVEVGSRTNEAYAAASRLLSEAEYGKFATAASFAGALDRYAEIDSLLNVAAASASALPTGGQAAVRARDLLVGQITGCRDRVRTVARIHQREGIAPDAGLTENARVACDLAARAANAMKP